ncbi:IS3 family transposase [Streptomyces canus]|uniref:IS3 family transposase n=1 Tax=Streptomyces canus TaxID=58343 RepID=UPI00099610FF|nr:IS3 family transposase [Streptomyces canus]
MSPNPQQPTSGQTEARPARAKAFATPLAHTEGALHTASSFMCGRLGVSRSGYDYWRFRPESATAQRREELKSLIEKAFDMSDGPYGHRRIQAQLRRWGVAAGVELFRRLMRELGLVPCQPGSTFEALQLTRPARAGNYLAHRGHSMAVGEANSWPPTGRTHWPLTAEFPRMYHLSLGPAEACLGASSHLQLNGQAAVART